MARLGHIFLTLLLMGALAAVAAGGWLAHEIKTPGPLGTGKRLYIEHGSSIKSIAATLRKAGIIREDLPFLIDARWQQRGGSLKAGEYQFPAGVSIGAIIALLQSGKTYQHKITIPEGLMAVEIVELLNNEPMLGGDIVGVPPEGSLLPETYKFSYGDTRQGMIGRMQESMREELKILWETRAADLPLKIPEEAVILASVVEKETGLPEERPRVAGVFINRLNRRMPLQSDPTVIYALTQGKEKLERALTYNDLRSPSPYNTYRVAALPPTSIANPGKASLAAVLNPEKNDYIYFVADGSGGHAFARTLQEHNKNVARWRALGKR